MQIKLGQNLLGANAAVAGEIRRLMEEKGLLLLNLMSSPGAGKTTLLEKTLAAVKERLRVAVIEGDVATTKDAERIARLGIPVVQINTHGACHLDAAMVRDVLPAFDLDNLDLLIVENVGNLVCPAEFDLGEAMKVVVLSTTEGNDKVPKYPLMFREAGALLLNKIDLLPFTDFRLDELAADLGQIHPGLPRFDLSARTGEGMDRWIDWLSNQAEERRRR
ncbi:hydrogenase nickel incorporation protein HypB [Heliobacterium gestii]|uniref:Hydrogenase nickel incorporation protein HypB n=1 Tax=Heliomicrobium gestii TaxID=2699 RepID=A0A845LEL8_HELGE|nr:hydrogenase nickel incorporation protein HypB [Heliomicrobium gestii]MBM7865736.1 hydrogenase nickel incorporation protein HypB [Heliomicrobium gestii]MZP41983.1 hydrogenase nickel incorporation protein HypB [Heliomicrobium gestii]